MLQPNRRKYRKEQKGRNTGVATRGAKVSFGEYGLKAIGRGRLTARQIESARRAMTRHIKRGGRIWIRISRTSPSPRSLPKSVWVTARVIRSIGLPRFSRVRCCTRWTVSTRLWLAKLSAWQLPSFRLRPRS